MMTHTDGDYLQYQVQDWKYQTCRTVSIHTTYKSSIRIKKVTVTFVTDRYRLYYYLNDDTKSYFETVQVTATVRQNCHQMQHDSLIEPNKIVIKEKLVIVKLMTSN